MTLAPGARLGPYEIQSTIGAGGMGEVYKARDSRLDRIVAVKVAQTGGALTFIGRTFAARSSSSLGTPLTS